jgi:DNA-binding phage protein
MARRSKDWNEGLANDLRNTSFAQKFILAAVEEEGLPLQAVLGKVIRAYGVKEFAKLVKMPSSNVLRAINPKHNPTQETLSRLLKAFGLTVTVVPIKAGKRAA